MPTRTYEQRLRAESAEQTRRRILEALYEQLREAPSQPVSIDQIARKARVARSTVYLIFGNRAGLFAALSTEMLEPGGLDRLREAVADPDAREHLRGGLRAGMQWLATHRDVYRSLHSMAALDQEAVGGAIHRQEKNRAGGMAYLAQRLSEQGVLRADVTVDQAADMLWLLTSFDAFDLLYTGRGLSVDEVAQTLITMAERSLCR